MMKAPAGKKPIDMSGSESGNPSRFDAQYGPLSAEYYQITKPIGDEYPDVPYYLKQLKKTKGRILEMGAGTGRLLIPLLKAGLPIEALEPSPYMRAWLEKNLKAKKLRCEIHTETAEDFIAVDTYEAILLSFGSFQLLNPDEIALRALKNFHASLKVGGRLYVDIDVMHPEPEHAHVWVDGGSIRVAPATEIKIGGARHWDAGPQWEKVHLRYEKWQRGKKLEEENQDFTLRDYSRTEFKKILKDTGFTKIEVVTDYNLKDTGRPRADSLTTCFIAEKS